MNNLQIEQTARYI